MSYSVRQKEIEEFMQAFINFSRLHRQKMEQALESQPSTPSQHKMLAIISQKKLDSQKDLAEELDISPAAVAVTLSKLEKSGYVNRTSAIDDARKNLIEITDEGKALLRTTKRLFLKMDTEFFKNITDEELKVMINILKKIEI